MNELTRPQLTSQSKFSMFPSRHTSHEKRQYSRHLEPPVVRFMPVIHPSKDLGEPT
jgi:hypothetical protein